MVLSKWTAGLNESWWSSVFLIPAVSSEQNTGGISHDMSGLMAAFITSALKWNRSQKSEYSLKGYKPVHSQLGSDRLMTMKSAKYHCWFFIVTVFLSCLADLYQGYPSQKCTSIWMESKGVMTSSLSIQLRTQPVVSIIIIKRDSAMRETSMCIVSIEEHQHIFYWQIKDYPFLLLLLETNPEFSKTSCFLPLNFHSASDSVVRDFVIKLFYSGA